MIGLSPHRPAEVTPPRAPGSVRRTATIDTLWPERDPARLHMTGRARDAFTPVDGGAPIVRAEDGFVAAVAQDRTIRSIEITPPRVATPQLFGARGGGHLRKLLAQIMPEELAGATPLYLLLDDISGASLVAGWVWSQWIDDWLRDRNINMTDEELAAAMAARVDICVGWAAGGTAATRTPGTRPTSGTPVPDLRNPVDPDGWHAFPSQEGVIGMRRARRIDVRREGGTIHIDSHFQDSGTHRDGGRVGLHEYLLSATADAETMRLTSLTADPRILPFPECPSATINIQQVVGEKLSDLRMLVLQKFRGTAGCTHLNDAVRALAEVPTLVGYLEEGVAL